MERLLLLILLSTLVVSFLLRVGATLGKFVRRRPEPSIEVKSYCEAPSLPRGSFHIVVAGYKYQEQETGIGFETNVNYLWDLGLTNADIFWYRRVRPEVPLRQEQGPCGMQLHERLVLPNIGRDALPFFNHIIEVWDHPPYALMFTHGHFAKAWHTSCDAVFARSAFVYREWARSVDLPHVKVPGIPKRNHFVTLTSLPQDMNGTREFDAKNWYGGEKKVESTDVKTDTRRRRRLEEEEEVLEDLDEEVLEYEEVEEENVEYKVTKKEDIEDLNCDKVPIKSPCVDFHQRWKYLLDRLPLGSPYKYCCASFIVPWQNIKRFPRKFYEDMLVNVMMDTNYTDACKGRSCFEFIIDRWFGDLGSGRFKNDEVSQFYNEMDGLVHGTLKSPTTVSDPVIQKRMARCLANKA